MQSNDIHFSIVCSAYARFLTGIFLLVSSVWPPIHSCMFPPPLPPSLCPISPGLVGGKGRQQPHFTPPQPDMSLLGKLTGVATEGDLWCSSPFQPWALKLSEKSSLSLNVYHSSIFFFCFAFRKLAGSFRILWGAFHPLFQSISRTHLFPYIILKNTLCNLHAYIISCIPNFSHLGISYWYIWFKRHKPCDPEPPECLSPIRMGTEEVGLATTAPSRWRTPLQFFSKSARPTSGVPPPPFHPLVLQVVLNV